MTRVTSCTFSFDDTVGAQIFVGTIFCGLNFRGDKFSWVVVAHENLTPTKNYLHETGMAQCEQRFSNAALENLWREEHVEYQKTL